LSPRWAFRTEEQEVTQAPQPCQEISLEQMSGGALARMRPDRASAPPCPPLGGNVWVAAAGSLAHPRRLGDNAGMARDDSRAQLRRVTLMLHLDTARPSGTLGWVSPVAPVVTQAAVGAGHRAARRAHRPSEA
jgi:hypothetical protein